MSTHKERGIGEFVKGDVGEDNVHEVVSWAKFAL